jgi:hypothetical protein
MLPLQDFCIGTCSLGSVGSEVGKNKVQLGNGEARPLVALAKPLSCLLNGEENLCSLERGSEALGSFSEAFVLSFQWRRETFVS